MSLMLSSLLARREEIKAASRAVRDGDFTIDLAPTAGRHMAMLSTARGEKPLVWWRYLGFRSAEEYEQRMAALKARGLR